MKIARARFNLLCAGLAAVGSITALSTALASTPLCTADLVSPKCEDLTLQPLDLRRNSKEADGVIFNYFRALNPKYSDEVRNFGKISDPRLAKRALDIAEDIRKSAISYIARGRPASKLSAENRAFIERLRTVQFRIKDGFSADCYKTGDPGVPNAAYNPLEHTVSICKSSLRVTSQWIAVTIAHELGHVVSACSMASPLIRFKTSNPKIDKCLFGDLTESQRTDEEKEIEGSGSVGFVAQPSSYAVNHEPESMREFIRCKAAEVVSGSQVANPEAYKEFSACIEGQNRTVYENWAAFAALRLESLPKTLSPERQALVDQAKQETPFRCFRKNEEQFSDSFGGHVYSAWATEKKMKPESFRLALNDFASIRCRERLSGEVSMDRLLYPTPSERIETLIQNPNAAKILQCQIPVATTCRLSETSYDSIIAPPTQPASPVRVQQ